MADEIDYRALLKRYMDNVAWHEGVYFIPPVGFSSTADGPWTEQEIVALEEIASELSAPEPPEDNSNHE